MSSEAILVLVVVGAAFSYLALERWLLLATEPAREEMVRLAAEMLSSDKYSEAQKDTISDMLDEAMDRWFLVYMVVRLPWAVWRMSGGKMRRPSADFVIDDKFAQFITLHFSCVSAANPLFAILWRIEIALLVLFVGLLFTTSASQATIAKVAKKLKHSTEADACRDWA